MLPSSRRCSAQSKRSFTSHASNLSIGLPAEEDRPSPNIFCGGLYSTPSLRNNEFELEITTAMMNSIEPVQPVNPMQAQELVLESLKRSLHKVGRDISIFG